MVILMPEESEYPTLFWDNFITKVRYCDEIVKIQRRLEHSYFNHALRSEIAKDVDIMMPLIDDIEDITITKLFVDNLKTPISKKLLNNILAHDTWLANTPSNIIFEFINKKIHLDNKLYIDNLRISKIVQQNSIVFRYDIMDSVIFGNKIGKYNEITINNEELMNYFTKSCSSII